MVGTFFQRLWLIGATLISATAIIWLLGRYSPMELERWFIPGVLGHEAGGYRRAPRERAFITRAMGTMDRAHGEAWGRENGLTPALAFSHNLGRVFPPELFSQHPEFFPLVEGQRLQPARTGAWYWNPDLGRPDVAAYGAEAARRQFTMAPEQEFFSLGINDARVFGESAELLALVTPQRWFRERPDYSNLVFTFMNRAAQELSRTYPRKYLGALAYYWAENAPDFSLRPQVVPFLTADRSQGYDANFWKEEMALQERWARATGAVPQGAVQGSGLSGFATQAQDRSADNRHPNSNNSDPPHRLGLYDYLYGSGFLIPRIHTKLLAENLRHARRVGFTDYFAEVNPNWGLDGPMPWLAAQLLQDPEQSADGLLDEYYRRYFKEAADPMRRFFERCEQRWMEQPGPPYWLKHYRNDSQAMLFPSAGCGELRSMLDEARALASTETVRRRVNLVSEAFGVTERFVAFEESREKVERRMLGSDVGARTLLLALRGYLSARRDFIRYTVALEQSEPLAVAPFDWSDYLKNDPVAEVLQTVQAAAIAKSEMAQVEAALKSWSEPVVDGLWRLVATTSSMPGRELLKDEAFAGPVQPARRIAGLEYGVALPAGWLSHVEPVQYHRAELIERDGTRVLRISGTKDTSVFQWEPVGGTGLHRASLVVRGHLSPGAIVSLDFSWLDVHEHHVGFKAVRLPVGEWPEWVTLQQAGTPPAGAVWVGMGLRAYNQVAGDWIEAREFHLRASR